MRTKKEPLDKALKLNGGNDEARTRPILRNEHAKITISSYVKHIEQEDVNKLCILIKELNMVA